MLDIYNKIHFVENKQVNLTPNTLRITDYFKSKFNMTPPYNEENTIKLSETEIIFPSSHFCTQKSKEENFFIHHFQGSWQPSHSRKDKINRANKLIITRFKLKNHNGISPILSNEKLLFIIKLSKKISYTMLYRHFKNQ